MTTGMRFLVGVISLSLAVAATAAPESLAVAATAAPDAAVPVEAVPPPSPSQTLPGAGASSRAAVTSLYDLKTDTLLGKPADLTAYRGKVALVVNVASYCGYTPQYKGLEALHRELEGKGFAVLGFPSNDFGEQEPGTGEEIATFCKLTYDVTFPMFAKVVTRPGPEQSAIYRFLGASGHLPAWNFAKYLVGKDGKVIAFYPSEVTPQSPALRAAITKALAAN